MYPDTLALPVICWDNLQEAIAFHEGALGEVPIIKAMSNNESGLGGAVLLVNPDKTAWTFLFFRQNSETNGMKACVLAQGQAWVVVAPPEQPKEELEL